ncbi:hypothetical protein [Burkholderia vietnamiensis]|uniref:hypothetical protein n=1 Tax=Burkholderia vietnamiensis TaxID=60552 RepID=UPI002650F88F|nr:hypothetical protein [Burkholderia vietnamiensis]MDN8035783.1 hypothetical protein [Burkholderia vietnamiensis]
MPSDVDYIDAARRHLADAHLLRDSGRLPNAGQLFGFAVECGLKAALIDTHEASVDANGIIVRPFKKHPPELINLALPLNISPNPRAAAVVAMLPRLRTMLDWNVDHRYWASHAAPTASLDAWEETAIEIDLMLDLLISGAI